MATADTQFYPFNCSEETNEQIFQLLLVSNQAEPVLGVEVPSTGKRQAGPTLLRATDNDFGKA